jgi:hypothetical protein
MWVEVVWGVDMRPYVVEQLYEECVATVTLGNLLIWCKLGPRPIIVAGRISCENMGEVNPHQPTHIHKTIY